MTISTNTSLDEINIRSDGTILLRFAKQVKNGDVIIASEWHRTSLVPGCDVDATLKSNDQHLSDMGYPPISDSDRTKIMQAVSSYQTDAVVKTYADSQAAQP